MRASRIRDLERRPIRRGQREAFLNLLVTQLQHQDPMSPQADGEFLAQLAQFSSLEQLQHINTSITDLVSLVQAAKEVTPDASADASA